MAFTPTGTSTLAISIVFPILAIIATLFRGWARLIKGARFGWDDWLCVVSTVLCVAGGILNIYGVAIHAVGEPVENLDTEQFVVFQKVIFINPCLLMPALAFIKVSILCFYKRIFITPGFHRAANVMIVITVLWGISTFLCQVFEQFPVSDNWTTDLSGAHTNFILNYSAFLMAWSALDLALDVIILCMPVFVIKTLHLETRRKFSLIGIFALGGLCVISECVRIYYQWVFLYNNNFESTEVLYTSIITDILIWSTIEPCVSVVAACLPTLGPIFPKGQSTESIFRSVRYFFTLRSPNQSNRSNRSTSRVDRNARKSSQESEAPMATVSKTSQQAQEEWHRMHSNGETYVLSEMHGQSTDRGITVKKTFASQTDIV